MAALRLFVSTCSRVSPGRLLLCSERTRQVTAAVGCRGYNKLWKPYLKELYHRRIKAGPEPDRHRSEWINWNYDAEIYAFGKRLGEDFNESTLRTIFIDKKVDCIKLVKWQNVDVIWLSSLFIAENAYMSYIEKEEIKRKELGVGDDIIPLNLVDNRQLAAEGEVIASRYVKAFLRFSYPSLFEEGICAIHDFLMEEEILATTGLHIGLKDLVLTAEFPVDPATMATSFLATIGGLAKDQGNQRAERFVNHFVLPHLVGKDVNDIWYIENPMGLLSSLLQVQGRGNPEPRLIHQSASQTIMSLYWIAIYSDRDMIGKAPGETVTIAEEMAARDCLRRIMKTSDNQKPLLLGPNAEGLQLDYDQVNPSVESLKQLVMAGQAQS